MPAGQRKIRILLADEQSLFRQAVRMVLEAEADLEVVAEARDGLQAVAEAERTRPDVALIDADLPNCEGVRAAALMTERVADCRIVLLSDGEDVGLLLEALEAGVTGYVTKESALTELIDAARAIHRGEMLIPPSMLADMVNSLIRRKRENDAAMKRLARLTRRERQVLALLAQGSDNGAIAQALIISPETARTHIQNVLGKLGVHSRLEAAAFVMKNKILDEEEMRMLSDGDGRRRGIGEDGGGPSVRKIRRPVDEERSPAI